jgi:hypothetical protein
MNFPKRKPSAVHELARRLLTTQPKPRTKPEQTEKGVRAKGAPKLARTPPAEDR